MILFFQRFLKKIKLFDLIVATLLLGVGIGLFLLFYRKAELIDIRVRVSEKEVLYLKTLPKNWYARRFHVGDYELDALGRKIAEVTNIERFAVDSEKDVVFLDIRVKATYDTRTKMYSTRGKTIMFGSQMRFNLQGITFDGIVTEFPGSKDLFQIEEKYIQVTALGRNLDPYTTKAVKVGQKVYDSNENLLAEILKVDIKPAEKVATTDKGELLLRYDPLYKDMILTVKVKTLVINGEAVMFDSIPVKVDQIIPLNFSDISLFPTIITIE